MRAAPQRATTAVMFRYHPDLAARPVPRYTSYPTAAAFTGAVGAEAQEAALAALPAGAPVSLYLHIPYCRQICWYCGCNTAAVGGGRAADTRLASYADTLTAEIDLVASRIRPRVEAIQFGGGSPNSLAAPVLAGIIHRLQDRFDLSADAEIGVELDPRQLSQAYVATLAAAGVNRVSLGAQTFAPHVQARINRIQAYDDIAAAVGWIRGAGIAGLNLDLMYGLPGQRLEDLEETVAAAIALGPDRIAMFGYAHMPSLMKRQSLIRDDDLPDGATRFAQMARAHALFTAAGFDAIGFDHFAHPDDPMARAAAAGRLRRNFQGYTDHPGVALIGLGATAISQFDGAMVQNAKAVADWRAAVLGGRLAGARGVAVTADDRWRGAIIEALLCNGAVDLGGDAGDAARREGLIGALGRLVPLAAQGLVAVDGWRVRLTEEGWPYARLVAQAFDAHQPGPAARFSRAA